MIRNVGGALLSFLFLSAIALTPPFVKTFYTKELSFRALYCEYMYIKLGAFKRSS